MKSMISKGFGVTQKVLALNENLKKRKSEYPAEVSPIGAGKSWFHNFKKLDFPVCLGKS